MSEYSLADRCGAVQSGLLGSSNEEALDGIIGFGQANSSVLSQLAASRKVKKIFSHCLDTIRGGGIFAIGELVEPKVSTTPLVPNMYVHQPNILLSCLDIGCHVNSRAKLTDTISLLIMKPQFMIKLS